jgi:hypothetical protein
MIPSPLINESSQTYTRWLVARRTRARARTLNSHRTALANTPHRLQHIHPHQLACTLHRKIVSTPLIFAVRHCRSRAQISIAFLQHRSPAALLSHLPPDAISCLGAFRTPVVGACG